MRGLKDKVAIVAGAAPGNIGGATAIRLAEEGTVVVAADLNEAAARSVVDEIRAFGGRAAARSFDITDEASYKELVDFTVKEFGRLDGLFNVAADLSAGTVGRDSDVISVPLEVWRHTIDVTLTGYMYGIRHALPIMIEQGSGAIGMVHSQFGFLQRNTSTEAAKAVVRRNTEEVQSRGNFDVFEELFADDFVDHTPQPNTTPDKDGVRLLYHTLRAAFPDFHAEIHWQAADGELVTTYKTYHGTQHGTFLGVTPTGRRIHFETVDVMRVRDGKITEHWGVANLFSLMRQLGAWPTARQA